MKKKTLLFFSLIVIIILSVIHIFVTPHKQDDIKNQQGLNTIYENIIVDSSYQSPIMRQLFNMKTPYDFIVHIPEADTLCKLTQLVDLNATKMVKGTYSKDYERGIVALDYLNIAPVKIDSPKNNIYFAAPFFVSNQGSGVFYYMGLFMQDLNKNYIRHIDSFFIGDRIEFVTLETQNDKMEIVIKTHHKDQSMSQPPKQTKVISLQFNSTGFYKK